MVVGAGPTGVEMAGQIAELAHRTLQRDFRAINTRTARVVLVDAAPQVLPPFGAKLGAKTKAELEKLGVEVMLGAMVTDVDERGIEMKYKDGRVERIDTVTKIWAAGVQASPLGRTLSEQTGAPLDRAGRIGVNPDLTLPGHPEVFVVGDMIALDNLPGVAQVAIQGAKYAAKEIDGRLKGKPPQKPFKYFDKGSMAIISRFRAVAMVGKLRLTGRDRLADVAGRAPRLHHRLQEPGHRGAALVRLVPRPRPLRAHHDRAADLRPRGAGPAQARRDATWCPSRGRTTPRGRCSRPPGARSSRRRRWRRPGSPTPASAAYTRASAASRSAAHRVTRSGSGPTLVCVLLDRLARPLRQDEHALGLDGDALGVARSCRRRRS